MTDVTVTQNSSVSGNSAIKDVLAAQSIMEMAELGRFDLSLAAYGFAYLEHNRRRYFVSGKSLSAAQKICELQLSGFCPTPIEVANRFIPDQSGSINYEEEQLKYDLALQLSKFFSQKELLFLTELNSAPFADHAGDIFDLWRRELIGVFDAAELLFFTQATKDAFIAHKLSREHFTFLHNWALSQLKQIDNEIMLSGPGKKTFWGFAVLDNGGNLVKYIIDANYASIEQCRSVYLTSGTPISPTFFQTIAISPKQSIVELRRTFSVQLQSILDREHLSAWQKIRLLPPIYSHETYADILSDINNPKFKRTLQFYKGLWQI